VDGWSLARDLKSAPATAAVPIIAFTGADLPHERASALRAGCDFHLGKPCLPSALLAALRRFVDPLPGAGLGPPLHVVHRTPNQA